jgi:hypothetical protein
MVVWTDRLSIRTSGGLLQTQYEPSGFIIFLEFLEWLSDWRLLNNDSAPWS